MHTSTEMEAQALAVLRRRVRAPDVESETAVLNEPSGPPCSCASVPRQARTKRRPVSLKIINDAVAALERAETVLRIGALVAEWETLDIKGGIDMQKEVRRFETWLIERALDETGGNQSRAARLLGLNKTTLHEKMKRYGIG